jgi:bis(5'-nucleosyl)-tetraphosphatase (symmetrical)
MPTYAIGDIQGCFDEFQQLLTVIQFDADSDTLWFTGDLVNRGPCSLEVLRFVKELGNRHVTILGNHDLHLLAVAYGVKSLHRGDTLEKVLSAPDRDELLDWLRQRPILHDDRTLDYVMTHAGLAPPWSLKEARSLAQEVEIVLRGTQPEYFLRDMYGNTPDKWSERLTGIERLRCIVNYFTRMRFCYADGRLDLSYKGEIAGKPHELIPWFDLPDRANVSERIIFGHWAALGGKITSSNLFALDTGCVWGNCLTAMRLEDQKRFSVSCAR